MLRASQAGSKAQERKSVVAYAVVIEFAEQVSESTCAASAFG